MRLVHVDHPLVAHKLTALRDERTDSATFRRLVDELVTLLAYEATRDLPVEDVLVTTPLETTSGQRLADPAPVVIPILRAGLGMLDGMVRLLPTAEIGFLGMVRDDVTLQPSTYADRLPHDLSGRSVFLVDPMLATGGTLTMAIDLVLARGARDVTVICLLAAPEGIDVVRAAVAAAAARAPRGRAERTRVTVVTGGVDQRLNERGYIVPGLGDAGDRLYGTV